MHRKLAPGAKCLNKSQFCCESASNVSIIMLETIIESLNWCYFSCRFTTKLGFVKKFRIGCYFLRLEFRQNKTLSETFCSGTTSAKHKEMDFGDARAPCIRFAAIPNMQSGPSAWNVFHNRGTHTLSRNVAAGCMFLRSVWNEPRHPGDYCFRSIAKEHPFPKRFAIMRFWIFFKMHIILFLRNTLFTKCQNVQIDNARKTLRTTFPPHLDPFWISSKRSGGFVFCPVFG